MINNYNSLSYRKDSVLSSQEPDVVGNSPNSEGFLRTWWKSASSLLSLLLLFSFFFSSAAELPKAIPTTAVTTCAGAIVLSPASLPITSQALVCGATNDLSATTVPATCGAATNSYKGGNEALYSLTPTVGGSYTISIAGQTWTSIFVYQGCPTAGGTCVGSVGTSASSKNLTVDLTAGLEYFIWFDTWPSPASPCPGTFSIAPPAPPTCVTAVLPANGATDVARNPSFSWTAGAGAPPTSYDVYLGTTTPAAFVGNVTTTSYVSPSLLVANTLYYYKVVAKNANGDATGCVEQSFTTGTNVSYCVPTTTSGCTDGDVIARVTLNTLDNNSGTGCPSGLLGYSDYTTDPLLTTTLQAGSSYGCTVFAGQYSEGYAAWIDYNDNGVFETSERIGFSAGQVTGSGQVGVLGSSATFPIVLACDPPLGPHRLRVRAMFAVNGSAVTPCGNNTFGEVEDYTVTISAADPCPAPTSLAVSNITASGADFSWVLGCAETAWEVAVVAAGSGAPASGTPHGSTSYSASGLSVGTAYDFYVRAACTPGSLYSSWSGPLSFTTTDNPPACTTLISPADAATNVPLTAGAVTLTWATPATSPTEGVATSYDVYFGTTSGALTLIGNLPAPVTGDPTVDVTGLLYNQTNYWRIVPRSTGGPAIGPCAEWSFTTGPAPANDICSGAVNLDVLTSPISDSTSGLNSDYAPSCSTTASPDAFYSITVPNGYSLSIGQTVNGYDSVHALFYGSCAAQTEILCLDDTDTTTANWTNTTGSTQTVYWVQDGFNGQSGTYTLAWTLTPPPVVVTSFDPPSVCGQDGGASITITGSNFTGTTAVEFNGIAAASFVVDSDTQITAVLPAGDTNGIITVYATPSSNGSASSASSLVVNPFPVVDPIVGSNEICLSSPTLLLSNASAGGTWSSSNEAVATVNSLSGEVTGLSEGTTVISYTVTENGCSTSSTLEVTVSQEVVITVQPTPVVVVTGNDAVFSVAATGTGLTYVWEESVAGGPFTALSELAPYSGTNTNTLTIDNTPGSFNNNEYRCVVSGVSPCTPVESSSALLNVGDTGIATNPSNVNLCDSGTAVFTVVATGDIVPPSTDPEVVYSYQWYEDQGLGPVEVVDGGDYSGANEATLTISNVTLANNGWTYFVVVNGPANDPQSTSATLNVSEGVSIATQPSSVSVCRATNTATFSVEALGSVSSIQWQVSPDGSTGWTNAGTGASLDVNVTESTPVGVTYYRAVVNGFAPCAPLDSNIVTLTVTQPTISVTPSSASYCIPGDPVSLTASGAATYDWSPATGLSATTGDTVTASPSETTTYTVTGTDASGCVNTTTVTVTVGTGLQGTATASAAEVCENALVQLGINPSEVVAPITINTGNYKFSATSGTYTPIVGGTSTSLPVGADDTLSNSFPIGFTFNYGGTNYTNIRVNSNGLLTFNATGNASAANNLATTTTSFRPGIAPLWDDLQCTVGVTYQVSGTAPNRVLTVQWQNMEWNWSSSVAISFQVKLYEGSNDIQLAYQQEAGGNPGGSGGASIGLMGTAATNYVSLQDSSANPTLSTTASTNNISAKPANGQIYTFKRVAPVTYTYEWSSTPAGFTSTDQNPTVNPSVSATYNVVVTASTGCTLSSSVDVNVVSGVTITDQPTAVSQCAGTDASFSVTATGPGLAYQWRKNGEDILGNASATTATLLLNGIVEADEASYDVVITPLCGDAVTSNAVALTVNDIPTAVASNDGPVCEASDLNLTGTTSNGVTFAWTGPAGFTSTDQNPSISNVSAANAGTYTFTATSADGCSFSGTTTVVVTPNPALSISSSGSATTACAGEIKTLTANYTAGTYTIYSENFNAPTNAWTTINNSTGGATPANVAWTLRPSPFTQGATFTSNDASQYYLSNPDAAGSGVTSNAILQSPAFSTLGYTSASVSYFHYYRHLTATQNVEYSTDGTNWVSFKTYNTTQGAANAFVQDTVALPAGALNQPTVYVRFRYQDGWAWYWAIDNFVVTGTAAPSDTIWSPTTDLYTDANATVPYTGGPATTVYAVMSSPVSYTATGTTVLGCTREASASFTMTTTGCPSTTNVQTALCGATLSTINQQIFANLVSGAQGYRFRVTDMTTNEVQSIDRNLRVFQLTQLTNYAFDRTYRVEVSVRLGGVWQPYYGAACTVTTPSPTTQVQAAQCGSTLTTMNDVIYANNVSFATGYRFRVTNLLTSDQQVIDRPLREIRITNISNPEFNTTYSIEVAVRNTDGTYLAYGPACNVTTPSFPTTQLQLSQCDVVITDPNAIIYADSYSGATTYRFRFVNTSLGYTYQFDKPLRSFELNTVPGLLPGETYSVQVSIEIGGEFGPFGKVCTLTTPGGARSTEPVVKTTEFIATAAPNPFADNFKLDVKTSTDELIQVSVYDMLGKLIETRNVTVSSITDLEVGTNYPAGVYNVIVSQGDNVKTLRVIKR